MTRFAGVVLSTMGLIAFGVGAPATYDQRQDGERNFSGKIENILIVVASPASEPAKPSVGNSELAAYLSLFGRRKPSRETTTQFYAAADDDDDDDDDDDSDDGSSKRESEDQEKNASPKETSADTPKVKARKARSLWGPVREVVDNKEGKTLKKELSWGQDGAQDEGVRSSDHNEVGLVQEGHFTLLGDGIEDCGPERRRNSYGVCQPYSDAQ